jgi:transcriptional regulator with XRE-family HTH domain
VGEKFRRLRLKRKISLVDLGKQTGLSPSMLSQLENGKLIPTLPTLTRIALVFEVGLEHFFTGPDHARPFLIVRAKPRHAPNGHGRIGDPEEFFESLPYSSPERSMELYVADLPPRAAHTALHSHEGSEFLYVISGQLEIRTTTDVHLLEAGDCCRFDSSEPHAYRCASTQNAVAFVIATPP